ncbi:MAG: CHRD domain-containing protein [bacterium]
MKKCKLFLIALTLIFIYSTNSFSAHSNFTASLTGEQEVPNVTTPGKGTATLTLTGAGGLRYAITVNDLSGPIVGAHFHLGSVKQNGPIIYNITASFVGNSAVGTIAGPLPDSIVAALLTSNMYVNVHTALNPSGEIRGQVNLSSGTYLIGRLDGANEVPALSNTAKGIASITLASVGGVGLAYSISVNGLSGPVVAAHFHFGKIGEIGPIVKDITSSFNGENAVGVWRTSGPQPLVDSLIVALLTGRLYVNVHTSANPGGEIRGQVELAAGFGVNANLNGASENPSVLTSALGTAELTFTDYALIFNVTVDGLSGPITGAHIHDGDSGVNGPIVFDITNLFVNNTATGRWKVSGAAGDLTAALVKRLFNNGLYVNVHTSANPTGEIRGQLKMKPGSGIGASLSGNQEVPAPIVTTATGTSALYTIAAGLQYFVTVNGLSGPIIGAHFHLGSIREGGPIVKDITASFTGNTASGVWGIADAMPFNDSLRRALVNGRIYMNIHTAANPTGEIRGQVLLTAGSGMTTVLDAGQENPPVITTAMATGSYTMTRGGLGFNIAANGLSGPITGAHFHFGKTGVNGPIVFDITPNVSGNNVVGYWRSVVTVDSLLTAILNGGIYVNLHTAANPNGEIRGQVIVSEGIGLTVQMTGGQEVPPTTTNGRGTGSATLTDAALIYTNTTDNLSNDVLDNPPFSAGIFNGPMGSSGILVKNVTSDIDGRNIEGAWTRPESTPITNSQMAEINLQNSFFDVFTSISLNPPGEIRGQIRTGALPIIPVQLISTITLTPQNSTKPVNTQHCVNAAVNDQNGVGVRNVTVDFEYYGANSGAGFAVTDTNGIAQFCYTGTNEGRDTIIARIVNLSDTAFIFWDEPLPVELSSFVSVVDKKNVTLNWTTTDESNNSGFEIERKIINVNEWTKVGFVIGSGSSNAPVNYTYTDRNLLTGKYNYRLKQIDFNGNFNYYDLNNEIEIGIPKNFNLSQNYPNPFNPSTKIDLELPRDGNVSISIYDNSGRLVANIMNEFRTAGYYTVNFNAANLASGIYFYKMQSQNFNKVLKMTLIK